MFRGVEKYLGICRVGTHKILWIALDKTLSLLILSSYGSVMSSRSECMQVTG